MQPTHCLVFPGIQFDKDLSCHHCTIWVLIWEGHIYVQRNGLMSSISRNYPRHLSDPTKMRSGGLSGSIFDRSMFCTDSRVEKNPSTMHLRWLAGRCATLSDIQFWWQRLQRCFYWGLPIFVIKEGSPLPFGHVLSCPNPRTCKICHRRVKKHIRTQRVNPQPWFPRITL